MKHEKAPKALSLLERVLNISYMPMLLKIITFDILSEFGQLPVTKRTETAKRYVKTLRHFIWAYNKVSIWVYNQVSIPFHPKVLVRSSSWFEKPLFNGILEFGQLPVAETAKRHIYTPRLLFRPITEYL